MTAIKILLILASLLLLAWAFRNRQRVGLRAGARLGAIALTTLAVVSIAFPELLQRLAELVGVARGTDLLLYTFVVVFVLTTTGLYFRFREFERRQAEIVRSVAIQDAVLTDGRPGGDLVDDVD